MEEVTVSDTQSNKTLKEATNGFSNPRTEKRSPGRPKGSLGPVARGIRDFVLGELIDLYERMTVRQIFYKCEVRGLVAKTENGFRQVQRQVLAMRREEVLPWEFVTDGTRWRRKPYTWDSVEDYLQQVARGYRRNLWQDQGARIEIWLEKEALADVILDVTDRWDVGLMPSRGQSSATFLYNAAKEAERAWQKASAETYIYALYDADGGGERASRTIARDLPGHALDVPIHFERLAVTEEQIQAWDLPSRPPKVTDPEWTPDTADAVELDAIEPDQVIGLVEDAITRHVDSHAWEVANAVEAEERRTLQKLASWRPS
jgi:hypothetical protein